MDINTLIQQLNHLDVLVPVQLVSPADSNKLIAALCGMNDETLRFLAEQCTTAKKIKDQKKSNSTPVLHTTKKPVKR